MSRIGSFRIPRGRDSIRTAPAPRVRGFGGTGAVASDRRSSHARGPSDLDPEALPHRAVLRHRGRCRGNRQRSPPDLRIRTRLVRRRSAGRRRSPPPVRARAAGSHPPPARRALHDREASGGRSFGSVASGRARIPRASGRIPPKRDALDASDRYQSEHLKRHAGADRRCARRRRAKASRCPGDTEDHAMERGLALQAGPDPEGDPPAPPALRVPRILGVGGSCRGGGLPSDREPGDIGGAGGQGTEDLGTGRWSQDRTPPAATAPANLRQRCG